MALEIPRGKIIFDWRGKRWWLRTNAFFTSQDITPSPSPAIEKRSRGKNNTQVPKTATVNPFTVQHPQCSDFSNPPFLHPIFTTHSILNTQSPTLATYAHQDPDNQRKKERKERKEEEKNPFPLPLSLPPSTLHTPPSPPPYHHPPHKKEICNNQDQLCNISVPR